MTKEINKLVDSRSEQKIKQDNREIFCLDYINERLEQEALNPNKEEYLERLEKIASLLIDFEIETNKE